MLTAIRELAEEAEAGGDLAAVVARGDDCVARTRELLPVLAEAGVVDAGAAGLVEILRGIVGALEGAPLPAAARRRSAGPDRRVGPSAALGVQVLHRVRRRGRPARRRRARAGAGAARRLAARRRRPDRAQGARPHRRPGPGALARRRARHDRERRDREHARQTRRARAAPAAGGARCRRRLACALVAVAAGSGNRRLFENLGAHVVDGGRTMNPSTAELLAAVEASGAREAILLPNDRNVVLTAEHAAEAAPVPVSVVPTTTLQAGLAAALAFDPGLGARRERRGDERGGRRRRAPAPSRSPRATSRPNGARDPQGRLARPRRREPGRRRRDASTRSRAPSSTGCSSGRAGSSRS